MLEKYPHLNLLIKESQSQKRLGVVFPLNEPSLETVVQLQKYALCTPVLIGPKPEIEALAEHVSLKLDGIEIVDTPNDPIAAAKTANVAMFFTSTRHFSHA